MEEYIKNQNDTTNEKDFELSHIIGINSNISNCVQASPSMSETVLYTVGGIVIVEDLKEKNNQIFFRHGKNQISAFKLSRRGTLIAVGFISENIEKKFPTSVILWNYDTKSVIYEFTGITKGVSILEFSPDDTFLAASGLDCSFFIWEIETGSKSFSRIYEVRLNFICWTGIYYEGKKPNYSLVTSNVNTINYFYFFYELSSMQYNMKTNKFTLPNTGFVRTYTTAVYDINTNQIFIGTIGGELIIFSMDNLIFKGSFNVINNGVSALEILEDGSLIIGGGDGKVKKMINNNGKYMLTNEVQLSKRITSLSLTDDKKEVVCGTLNGYIYRLLCLDLTFTIHSFSHTASVNDITYCQDSNDHFYVVDDNGLIVYWDISEFQVRTIIPSLENEKAKSVAIGEDSTIFVGYSTGFLKNFSRDGKTKYWDIPAHKGNVNCLYVDENYILSGGEDGIVRVWTRKTHELLIQFPAHHRDVRSLFCDISKGNLIYSAGGDRNIACYDLKLQKRVNLHTVKNGVVTAISQKKSDDNEIISVGHNCPMTIWDFYQTSPIGEINLNTKFNAVKVNNKGNYIALGSDEGEVWFFQLPRFELVGKSNGHSLGINNLNWSPDDKQLVSVGADNSICIWNFYRD